MHLYRIAARSYIGSLGMEAFVLARLISVDLPLSLRSFFFSFSISLSLSIPYSPSRSRTRHSPVYTRPPPKSTPYVLHSKRGMLCLLSLSSIRSLAVHCISLSSSLFFSLYFALSLLHFCLFSLRRQFRESMLAHTLDRRSRYDSFHYHTIIFCRRS